MNTSFLRSPVFLAWAAFVLMFFASFRFFFFNDFDSVGHNWDWGFPALDFLFRNIDGLSLFSWNEFNLGKEFSNLHSHLVPNVIVSILGTFLSVKMAIFVIFFGIFCVAFLSFKKNADYLLSTVSPLNYLPSLLYAFRLFFLMK